MKSSSPQAKSSAPPQPHRLRDDPVWQGHYNAILGGLFSRFECGDYGQDVEDPRQAFEAMSKRCQLFVTIAYQGANHAHAHTHLAEPYTDAEIAAFNSKL
jgi:hypothetical protein